MGFDLDLAVSYPESGFSSEYARRFEHMTQEAASGLRDLGLQLPVPLLLPANFPFRVSIGSYSSTSALIERLRWYVRELAEHRYLPGTVPSDAPPNTSLEARQILGPLAWSEHALALSPGTFAVPVEFDEVFRAECAGETIVVVSAQRALDVYRLVFELATLDENTWWNYQALMPERDGEAYRGSETVDEGLPQYSALLGNVQHLSTAMEHAVKFRVCVRAS